MLSLLYVVIAFSFWVRQLDDVRVYLQHCFAWLQLQPQRADYKGSEVMYWPYGEVTTSCDTHRLTVFFSQAFIVKEVAVVAWILFHECHNSC